MRILGPVVQISALPVFNIGKQLTLRHTVAAQLVGDENARHILQTLRQTPEETLCCPRVAAALHQDIEYDPVLVNGAPQEVQLALDPNEHFIEVPLVTRPGSPLPHLVGEARTELQTPLPDALARDDHTALAQQQFDVPKAQTEYVVQPDRVADQLSREAVAIVWVGWVSHPTILTRAPLADQHRLT